MRDAGLDEGLIDLGRRTERGGDGGWQERRIAQRGKIDEDDTVGKLRGHLVRDGEGQSSLPDTTRSREGEQRGGLIEHRCSCGSDLSFPPYQRGPGQRQGTSMVERRCGGHGKTAID